MTSNTQVTVPRTRLQPTPSAVYRNLGELIPLMAQLPEPAQEFLTDLARLRLITSDEMRTFLESRMDRLGEYRSAIEIGQSLVEAEHITEFQLERVVNGQTHGLHLGNYLVLDQVGSGGMGTVYLGKHSLMKRRVAIKVMPVDDDCHPSLLERFYSEMRVLAELNHPNVVTAFDAGEAPAPGPNMPSLIYLVMELVEGGDIEDRICENGVCTIAQGCHWIRQAAEGLQAAHDRHVVHRDVKPSNLLLTAHNQVKVVDFGLARQFCSQLTDPRALLGSIEFMAPEQSHDPSAVGMAADTYGLGATLFWMLAGEPPYPFMKNVGSALRALQREEPRRLREFLPDAPVELDELIAKMLARDPQDRPAPLLQISRALSRFCDDKPGSLRFGDSGIFDPTEVPGDLARRLQNKDVRIAQLTQEIEEQQKKLEQSVTDRSEKIRQAHDALLFAMAKMAESRDGETPGHLRRLQRYARTLAEQAATGTHPTWCGLINETYLAQLDRCIPLHDIGKIGLPDEILLKPGALDAQERALVETHPIVGDRILASLAKAHGESMDFLGMARAIVRWHHERYDGQGYPDRLQGDAIPPAARLAHLADVYDALRRARHHKEAMSHTEAMDLILGEASGEFDPVLLDAFEQCQSTFEKIFREVGD